MNVAEGSIKHFSKEKKSPKSISCFQVYEYTANAYLYIDYSISGPVQVVQNMPNMVTKSGLQKYK